MTKNGFLYKQVHGRRSTDRPSEKQFAIDWWKIVAAGVLSAFLAWASWVTFHGFMAESNKEEVEQLKNEKVAELKAYVDLQVGVLHGRVTKVDDRINDIVWQFFDEEVKDCRDELNNCQGN